MLFNFTNVFIKKCHEVICEVRGAMALSYGGIGFLPRDAVYSAACAVVQCLCRAHLANCAFDQMRSAFDQMCAFNQFTDALMA